VVFRVNQANAYRAWLGEDWVAVQYDQIARGLPRTDDWNPVRRVMAAAYAALNADAGAAMAGARVFGRLGLT